MSKTQAFINVYNQLDDLMRAHLGANKNVSHADLINTMAKKSAYVRKNVSRLHAYRALRNALVHIPYDGSEPKSIAEPHEEVLLEYQRLLAHIQQPPKALDGIAITDVMTVTWETSFAETLETMLANSYRLAPIVENGNLVGVFDVSTLASVVQQQLTQKKSFYLDATSTFSLFREGTAFLERDPQNLEGSVLGVAFVEEDALVEDVTRLFQDFFAQNLLLSVVCITPTGRAFEPLLGIVTAHDLSSSNAFISL